jgi:DNA-binding XRE family transcriptional regulator
VRCRAKNYVASTKKLCETNTQSDLEPFQETSMHTSPIRQRPTRSPLFRWRTDARLSQAEAAKRLDIAPTQYASYETGKHLPRPSLLAAIGSACGVPEMGAAIVLYFYGVTREEAAWFFQTTGQS